MRNILTMTLAVLLTATLYAQKDVVSAYNLMKDGQYEAAAESIDRAITQEKAMAKEKTWRYRGDIYRAIALDSALYAKHPEALKVSLDSYFKAKELDTKETYLPDVIQGIDQIQIMANNYGITEFTVGNYLKAAELFQLSTEVSRNFNVIDTLATFNTSLSYEKAGELSKAIEGYQTVAALGYQVPNVYLFIAGLQQQMNDTTAALTTLQNARKTHPEEQALIIEELNIYLRSGDYEKAESNLRMAAEQEPDNELLFFSMGSVYDNLKRTEEAEKAYLRALEIKPDYFDANYNLGALYFNQGVLKVNEANEVPPSQNKKYKALIDQATAAFTQALPFLEQAYVIDNNDLSTVRSLRDIYARTGDDDKLMEMTKRIEELK
jgi:tetratricopeptide (TPR) repeat protein